MMKRLARWVLRDELAQAHRRAATAWYDGFREGGRSAVALIDVPPIFDPAIARLVSACHEEQADALERRDAWPASRIYEAELQGIGVEWSLSKN